MKATQILFGVVLAGAVIATEQAYAQNLFEALSRLFGGQQQALGYAPSTTPHITPDPHELARRTSPQITPDPWESTRRQETAPPRASSATIYCVRLCDGRFFPLPRDAGAPHGISPAQICSAMCPASETRVYSGASIERAVAQNGTRYASLENAFRFRKEVTLGCSCTTTGAPGMTTLAVEQDSTLRPGDIIVTTDGPRVFTGRKNRTDHASNFVRVEEYKDIPAHLREQLATMRVTKMPDESASAAPVASTPVSSVTWSSAVAVTPTMAAIISLSEQQAQGRSGRDRAAGSGDGWSALFEPHFVSEQDYRGFAASVHGWMANMNAAEESDEMLVERAVPSTNWSSIAGMTSTAAINSGPTRRN